MLDTEAYLADERNLGLRPDAMAELNVAAILNACKQSPASDEIVGVSSSPEVLPHRLALAPSTVSNEGATIALSTLRPRALLLLQQVDDAGMSQDIFRAILGCDAQEVLAVLRALAHDGLVEENSTRNLQSSAFCHVATSS